MTKGVCSQQNQGALAPCAGQAGLHQGPMAAGCGEIQGTEATLITKDLPKTAQLSPRRWVGVKGSYVQGPPPLHVLISSLGTREEQSAWVGLGQD